MLKDKHVPFILAKQGRDNVFKYYALDQPLTTAPLTVPFKDVLVPGDTFFELMETPGDSHFYASGDIGLLKLDGLYTEDSLREVAFPLRFGQTQVNFWFSTTNVTAYTHYDTSDNLHVVIYGKKRFLFFPPSAHLQMKPYPCLHELYRQVQVRMQAFKETWLFILSFKTVQVDVLQSTAPLAPIEVTVSPGQVLYIPPYWFHCVVSMEPSISLNVWSNSDTFEIMERVYRAPIPFEEDWGEVKLMKVLQYYVGLLVNTTANVRLADFIRETVYSRYETVLKTRVFLEEGTRSHRQFCLSDSPSHILSAESLDRIHSQHNKTSALLLEINPLAVRHINLGNYVEHLAWRILGDKGLVQLPFFLECFN